MAYTDEEAEQALGELILQLNPYSYDVIFLPGFQSATQIGQDLDPTRLGPSSPPSPTGTRQEFDARGFPPSSSTAAGQHVKIRRWVRIPYLYRDSNNSVRTEHILIGYEGDGGP